MVETKVKHKPHGPYERFVKRPLDIFCSLLAIVVFWWLFVIVAILVRVKLGSPVLFTQDRPASPSYTPTGREFRKYSDFENKSLVCPAQTISASVVIAATYNPSIKPGPIQSSPST